MTERLAHGSKNNYNDKINIVSFLIFFTINYNMNPRFDINFYKKFNPDLKNLDDKELIIHYELIGKNQMRLYNELSFFKKNKIYIFTCKYGYYISRVIQYLLFKNFSMSEIIYDINPYNEQLHIILFSQKVKVFPRNYIIYQLEQKDISTWIDKKYELSIYHSVKTWDYSQSNIDKFPEIIKKKMIFFPIPIIPNNNPSNDILFYGSLNDIRKKKLYYLQNKLSNKYKIKIVNNKFGKELIHEILNSKIVLNIHFYENAILETCRINEVLSCDKIVISEKPNMIDIENYKIYQEKIIFINNMDEMYENIIQILE